MHALARREAADQVDEAAQRRVAVGGGERDDVGDAGRIEQVGLDELEAVALLDALELGLDDPRHHHAPAVVEQPIRDRDAKPAGSPVTSAVLPIRAVRTPLYLRCHAGAGI